MEEKDSELVDLARAGNKEAFGRLIDRHQAQVTRVAIGMVRNEDVAQELVQEAMLQAYLSLDRLREGARFASWLHGIVRNVCRHSLRASQPDCLSWEDLERCPGLATPAAADPGLVAEQREQARLVLDAVHTLSAPNREATLLFYYEQRSLQEIAGALGASVGAIKGRLHQSRKQLRERLLPLYPEAIAAMRNDERSEKMVPMKIAYLPQSEPKNPAASEEQARQYLMQLITATGSWRDWTHLVAEDGHRYLPLSLGRDGHVIVALLEGAGDECLATGTLVAGLLKATNTLVEQVRVERLNAEILHGVVCLRRGGKETEIAARLGEVIALAVQASAPVTVASEIMDDASWDLTDPIPVVQRILQAGDAASLRQAAEMPIVGRVAQAFLERGMRYVQDKDGHRSAEVLLETRRQDHWTAIWLVFHYGSGSSGGGNISLPLDALPVLIARFKLMANLDLAGQHTRQQGHTSVQRNGRDYDLQVTTEPAEHGEKVTLRLEQLAAAVVV